MTGRTFLGVDAGTSVAKAVLFDESGEALVVHGRELPLQHVGDDGVEQDPELVLDAVGEVVRRVLAEGHPTPELLALTGQGDGLWLLDGDHRPVRPALSWLDGRAGRLLADWVDQGVTEAVFASNGCLLFPGAPGALLAWMDRHEPDVLDRATTAGSCKDMLLGRLTGLRATDPSDSTMPFGDGSGTSYSAEVLDALGLAHRADLLAPIHRPLPRATIHAAGAEATGLPEGLPVLAGPFDFPACAVGGGVEQPGDGLLIVGTTLGCLVRVPEVVTTGERAGFHVATDTQPLRAMPAMVGTASLDWMLTTLGLEVGAVELALSASPPGARGVQVLPYLATSGERAPFVDAAARGQIDGVRMTTTRDDLLRAMCEGLAYAARHCFEVAGHHGRVVVCGGGTRSPGWVQVFADVLGSPVEHARTPEVGARGAVLSALRAEGIDVDEAAWTAPQQRTDPDAQHARLHDHGYARYLEHLSAARPFWSRTEPATPEAS